LRAEREMRSIALTPSDGFAVGAAVLDTGGPQHAPVGAGHRPARAQRLRPKHRRPLPAPPERDGKRGLVGGPEIGKTLLPHMLIHAGMPSEGGDLRELV